MIREYDFVNVNGHIEVYYRGEFQFSADTMAEAYHELEEVILGYD